MIKSSTPPAIIHDIFANNKGKYFLKKIIVTKKTFARTYRIFFNVIIT